MDYWPNHIYKKQILKFRKEIFDYCDDNSIDTSIESFLFHKWNGFTSATYTKLMDAPKIFLCNSVSFRKYYSLLDADLKNDIMTQEEFKALTLELKANKEIHKFLREIMTEESVV